MGLVDKIKSVKVEAVDGLAPEDKAFCDYVTEEAEEVRLQLLEKYQKSMPIFEKETLGYGITSYGSVERDLSRHGNFSAYKFTEIYSLKAIKDLLSRTERLYKSKIIEHFSHKYNITLNDSYNYSYESKFVFREFGEDKDFGKKSLETPFSYTEIIDWIIKETGGVDFVEVGHIEFKDLFRGYFQSYGSINYTASGATLRVEDFYPTYKNYSGNFESDRVKNEIIQKAFNFFEVEILQGCLIYDNSFMSSMQTYINFELIQFENLDKINSIKLFKNRRADIKFRDAKTLNDFIHFYQLDKVPDNH